MNVEQRNSSGNISNVGTPIDRHVCNQFTIVKDKYFVHGTLTIKPVH